MNHIIEINHLIKHFGAVKAVDDISFHVKAGSLFAFLGLNGAGKSTTINILCNILQKDAGEININGNDLDANPNGIKKDIGIVFQTSVLDERLTVKDNLKIRASYYGIQGKAWSNRLEVLTDMLDLQEILSMPFGKLSGGQKRRVDIARGLIHEPTILFLDEPTTGLDPKTRQMVWNMISHLQKERNMTVFLTTHYMEEANKADMVVIMDSGHIVAYDTPNNLKNQYTGDFLKLYSEKNVALEALLNQKKISYQYEGECYLIKVVDSGEAKTFILENADYIHDFEVIKGDMDDVFLTVTGKKLQGDEQS